MTRKKLSLADIADVMLADLREHERKGGHPYMLERMRYNVNRMRKKAGLPPITNEEKHGNTSERPEEDKR